MALALVLRSQSRNHVSALLSNVARVSTSSTVASLKTTQRKNIALASPTLVKLSPSLLKNDQIRTIALSAPRLSATGGSHSALWTAERALSAALIGLLPGAIAFPSQTLDTLLAISIVMHGHWGLEACVTDYIRAAIFGATIPKLAHILLLVTSATTLAGLLYFIYTDIGIGNAVRKLWAVKGQ